MFADAASTMEAKCCRLMWNYVKNMQICCFKRGLKTMVILLKWAVTVIRLFARFRSIRRQKNIYLVQTATKLTLSLCCATHLKIVRWLCSLTGWHNWLTAWLDVEKRPNWQNMLQKGRVWSFTSRFEHYTCAWIICCRIFFCLSNIFVCFFSLLTWHECVAQIFNRMSFSCFFLVYLLVSISIKTLIPWLYIRDVHTLR